MSSDREDVGDVTYVSYTLHNLGFGTESILAALNALQLDPKSRWKNLPKDELAYPERLVNLIEQIGRENPDCELVLNGCSQLNTSPEIKNNPKGK